jgi:hypothetical protein
MLRFLYTICDWLAGLCAMISPLIIVHWLLKVTGLPWAVPFVNALNPIFNPWSELLQFLVKTPPLFVNGQPVETTQAALAIAFTLGFFAFHFSAEVGRSLEQRLDMNRQTRQQRQKLMQMSRDERQHKQQLSSLSWRICLNIHYPFPQCPMGSRLLDDVSLHPSGKLLERSKDVMSMEFTRLDSALQVCTEAAMALLQHYATLRPADPQPPFHIGLHAVETQTGVNTALAETERITEFAGKNQIVFSETVQRLMEAQHLALPRPAQSIGLYALSGGRQEEMFRLDLGQPSR